MNFSITAFINKKISVGKSAPLGATLTKSGVNFAIYSEYAQQVYLVLFADDGQTTTDCIGLFKNKKNIWQVFVRNITAGQLYGYRVVGDYNPAHGKRFNPAKLLIDPYAKSLSQTCRNRDNLLFGYDIYSEVKDLSIDQRDSASVVPKSVVVNDDFNWQNDRPVRIPIGDLVVYEAHLKGFTADTTSGVEHPGTFMGFAEKIPYLKKLGVNVVEFLPVQAFYNRDTLLNNQLGEYWGYNTIGFFAPEPSYSTQKKHTSPVQEFKSLVKKLHQAKIEVIIDVVLNHSGEGSELGPTLSFRGIDNATYYTLTGDKNQPYRYTKNDTGCGNTVNAEHPQVMKFLIDCLKYWVEKMHVDGFRFDMASVLARLQGNYQKNSLFFDMIARNPVLQKVKMIAEPWDLHNYNVGDFPLDWSEWNGRFRDTVRKFIRGDTGQIADLAWRLTGSADLFSKDSRSPYNSINFVTCHDGFTLADLFSYSQKHNEANKENNQDGITENHSCNCGHEGPTKDKAIINLRKQLVKNAFCCLLFSLGVPMVLAGDEFLRTQQGNNNAYCQANKTNWLNWKLLKKNHDIFQFVQKAIRFRKRYSILRRKHFLTNRDYDSDSVPEIAWFGDDLKQPDWHNVNNRLLCYQLDGSEEYSKLKNYHLFFIYNSDDQIHDIRLPTYENMSWHRVVDTSQDSPYDFLDEGKEMPLQVKDRYLTKPKSAVVLLGKEN